MACEQMKYMAASPPTASLIICSVLYTRKKYTDIGKSFTVIPVSGGLWKMLALAGPWQNKVLKYSEPAYAFVTDGRKNKVEYISKTENMNIKRAKTRGALLYELTYQQKWSKTNFKAKKHLLLCSFIPENFLKYPFFSLLHFKITETDSFVFSVLNQQTAALC